MKFFIDTDIGDDIDDLLTLVYALEKKLDIVGITTVYREAEKRVPIVKKILGYKGVENIPVYAGYSKPLSTEARIFGRLNYPAPDYPEATNEPDEAIAWMAECAERYGDDLCILVLGAQTNLAHAWMRFPERMKKVGHVAIMGGCFTLHHNEWNIAGDPTAARIVLESEMKLSYMPWDITKDICLTDQNYEDILNLHAESLQGHLADQIRQWKESNCHIPILHDPATLICVLNPNMCTVRDTRMYVLDSGPANGITLNLDTLNRFAQQPFDARCVPRVVDVKRRDIVNEFMTVVFGITAVDA